MVDPHGPAESASNDSAGGGKKSGNLLSSLYGRLSAAGWRVFTFNGEREDLDAHPSDVWSGHFPHQRGELVAVAINFLHRKGSCRITITSDANQELLIIRHETLGESREVHTQRRQVAVYLKWLSDALPASVGSSI